MEFGKSVLSLPFEPVVGGCLARVVFMLLAFGVIGLGVNAVVQKATGEWTTPFAEITTEYELELAYPDLYICIPAYYVSKYKDGGTAGTNYMVLNGVGGSNGITDVRTTCAPDASMPTRITVESFELANAITGVKADSCPYKPVTVNTGAADMRITFGCDPHQTGFDPSTASFGCVSPTKTGTYATRAQQIVDKMSTYKKGGVTYKPVCVGFESTGLKQKRDDPEFQIVYEMDLK